MNPYIYINIKRQTQPPEADGGIARVLGSPAGTLLGLIFVFFLACAAGVYALFAYREIAEAPYDAQAQIAGSRRQIPRVLGEKTGALPKYKAPYRSN